MKSASKAVLLIIYVGIVFVSVACQTPAGRTVGEVVDDATITTKVKAKLFDESILRGFAISVDTFDGEVTLTGAVDNESQKQKASEIAVSTHGVHKVNNLIIIKKNGK